MFAFLLFFVFSTPMPRIKFSPIGDSYSVLCTSIRPSIPPTLCACDVENVAVYIVTHVHTWALTSLSFNMATFVHAQHVMFAHAHTFCPPPFTHGELVYRPILLLPNHVYLFFDIASYFTTTNNTTPMSFPHQWCIFPPSSPGMWFLSISFFQWRHIYQTPLTIHLSAHFLTNKKIQPK